MTTLSQYLDNAQYIYENTDITNAKNNLSELHQIICDIQSVSIKIANMYNIINNKSKIYKLKVGDVNAATPFNEIIDNDYIKVTSRRQHKSKHKHRKMELIDIQSPNIQAFKHTQVSEPIKPSNLLDQISTISNLSLYDYQTDIKEIAQNVSTPVVVVKNIHEIPSTSVYWISSLNQFAVKINNVLFRGNVGDIYRKEDIQKLNKPEQITICKRGNACSVLLAGESCKFYHDPNDVNKLYHDKKITHRDNKIRNFVNTSWVYTDKTQHKKNMSMRHFGSRSTLKHDIDLIKINMSPVMRTSINNFEHQCMHDILVNIGIQTAVSNFNGTGV
jgi:hypothetical protein